MNGTMNSVAGLAERWWFYVLHASWQSTLLAGVILALVWMLRRRSASFCYGLLLVALLKFAIPPALSFPTGLFSRVHLMDVEAPYPMLDVQLSNNAARSTPPGSTGWPELYAPTIDRDALGYGEPSTDGALAEEVDGPGPSTTHGASNRMGVERQFPRLHSLSLWKTLLLAGHLSGSLVFAAWIVCSWTVMRRLTSRCRPAEDHVLDSILADLTERMGLRRRVRLLAAPGEAAPMAFGLVRPTMVLPHALLHRLSKQELTMILAHELAHFRRKDIWILMLENSLLLAWWFNPVLWLVLKTMRRTREDCCDDLVLAMKIGDNDRYAGSLMSVAKGIARPNLAYPALAFAERLHPLGRRLQRIMDATVQRSIRLSRVGTLALVVTAMAVLPGLKDLRAANQAADESTTAGDTVNRAPARISQTGPADADRLLGELVFHGRYNHRSRGSDIPQPSELWLKQSEEGGITAIAHLPFMESTEIAKGDKNHRLAYYQMQGEASGDRPAFRIELALGDGKVLLTRQGVRQDCDQKELSVPPGATYSPNARPDSYCAANILLRDFNLKDGQSREFCVYDWDNTGQILVDYMIRVEHLGKEMVEVPAGTFEANHLLLRQLTSANTWFKKRAGHETDFWVLDNGVIVRVLRHREPYELLLLDCDSPQELPGWKQHTADLITDQATTPSPSPPGTHALWFDGRGDYVEVPHHEAFDLESACTLEAWVCIQPGGTYNPRFLSKGWDYREGGYEFGTWGTSARRALYFGASGLGYARSNVEIAADRWHHVAMTYYDGQMCMFVDGKPAGRRTLSKPLPCDVTPLNIGRNSRNGTDLLRGAVDELRVWKIARTEDQIRSHIHEVLTGNEEGLVAYWDFEEGNGQVVRDKTSNGHDGRLGSSANADDDDPTWITPKQALQGGSDPTRTQTGQPSTAPQKQTGNVIVRIQGEGMIPHWGVLAHVVADTVDRPFEIQAEKVTDGFFLFRGLAEGSYDILVPVPLQTGISGRATVQMNGRAHATVEAGKDTTVDIVFHGNSGIRGTFDCPDRSLSWKILLLDGPNRTCGASWFDIHDARALVWSLEKDASYEIRGIPAGQYTVIARCCRGESWEPLAEDKKTISLDAGQIAIVDFRFPSVSTRIPEAANPPDSGTDATQRYADDLGAFINEIDGTYPFFDLKGIRDQWQETKQCLTLEVRACRSDAQFLRIILEAIRCLRDSHVRITNAKAKVPWPAPEYYPQISFMPAQENTVVVMFPPPGMEKVLPTGTLVKSIDGQAARDYLDIKAKAVWQAGWHPSPQRARLFAYRIPLQGPQGTKHTIVVQRKGKDKEFVLESAGEARGWPHTYHLPADLVRVGSSFYYTELPGGPGYMYLRRVDASVTEGVAQAMESYPDVPGWIVDLRGNGGGGYDNQLIERIRQLPRPVAVLIDAGCMSAGETLARDLKRVADARLFGTKTAGSSSAKRTWTFPSGIASVVIPTRSRWRADGEPIEYNGIDPDEFIEPAAPDLLQGLNSEILVAQKYILGQHTRSTATPQGVR